MAYVIGEDCIACGTCIDECPVGAISEGERYSSPSGWLSSFVMEYYFVLILLKIFNTVIPAFYNHSSYSSYVIF